MGEFQPPHSVCSVGFPWLILSRGEYLNDYLSLQTTVFEMRCLSPTELLSVILPGARWALVNVWAWERPHLAHTLLLQGPSSASECRLVLRSLSLLLMNHSTCLFPQCAQPFGAPCSCSHLASLSLSPPALSAIWSSAQLLTLKSGIFSVKFLLRSFFLNDPISLLSFPLLLEEIA